MFSLNLIYTTLYIISNLMLTLLWSQYKKSLTFVLGTDRQGGLSWTGKECLNVIKDDVGSSKLIV